MDYRSSRFSRRKCSFFLVVNKTDLLINHEDLEQIRTELSDNYQIPVFLTSAKTGENITTLFDGVGKALRTLF